MKPLFCFLLFIFCISLCYAQNTDIPKSKDPVPLIDLTQPIPSTPTVKPIKNHRNYLTTDKYIATGLYIGCVTLILADQSVPTNRIDRNDKLTRNLFSFGMITAAFLVYYFEN